MSKKRQRIRKKKKRELRVKKKLFHRRNKIREEARDEKALEKFRRESDIGGITIRNDDNDDKED